MLRYSEIPRDFSADNLATFKICENTDDTTGLHLSTTDQRISNDAKCVSNTLDAVKHRKSSVPASVPSGLQPEGCFYTHNRNSSLKPVPVHTKTQSLPNRACHSNYSCAVFDILRIAPEDFATQLTILDWPVFSSIQPDELTSCGWNKKNKLNIAPNVVTFSRRFNHVCFWVVQEILAGSTVKQRAETLTFFVKIARKLYELNNLHSLFAVVSALQCVSVYRLSKTWSCVAKKDRQTFDRLAEVFSDENNWTNLRSHIESLKLPCIPYLGLYLTDLVYIDMAHPHSGGLESQQRTLKMNNILRIISNYQQHSDYSNLTKIPHIIDYLNSIRYIEELQKFVEDDQYKLSLKLEPPNSSNNSSKESVQETVAGIASLSLSPARASSGSLRLQAATSGRKFVPAHRKCRSLGTKFRSASLPRNFHKPGNSFGIFTKPHLVETVDIQPGVSKTFHLLDDSELEGSQFANPTVLTSPTNNDLMPLQASHNTEDSCTLLTRLSEDGITCDDSLYCPMQGSVRRKTVLKQGRKPTVSSWQRYWLQIRACSLVYFSPKTFKGHQRSDFKREPCKMVSLSGCQAFYCDTTLHQDIFQLVDHCAGNVYKFRAGTRMLAEKWCKMLQQASTADSTPLPSNLMSFD